MLVNCKQGCKGKRGTTNALIDVETNKAFCDFCDEELILSSFVKSSMKQRGEIIKKDNRKAFQFKCETCKKIIETEIVNGNLLGKNCDKGCSFNISNIMINTIKMLKEKSEDENDE